GTGQERQSVFPTCKRPGYLDPIARTELHVGPKRQIADQTLPLIAPDGQAVWKPRLRKLLQHGGTACPPCCYNNHFSAVLALIIFCGNRGCVTVGVVGIRQKFNTACAGIAEESEVVPLWREDAVVDRHAVQEIVPKSLVVSDRIGVRIE